MNNPALSLSTSLILMLASFPLISFGTTGDRPVFMWLGLIALLLGGLIPLVRRFVKRGEKEEKPPSKTGPDEDVRVS